MMATLTVNESDLDLCSSTCGSFLGAMESLELIEKGFRLVADLCIKGIEVNAELARKNAEMSTSLGMMVPPYTDTPSVQKLPIRHSMKGNPVKKSPLRRGLLIRRLQKSYLMSESWPIEKKLSRCSANILL